MQATATGLRVVKVAFTSSAYTIWSEILPLPLVYTLVFPIAAATASPALKGAVEKL